MSHKYVYLFSEGNGSMRELLGGKGANLAEMTKLGLPVPQGFTISTEACTQYYNDGRQINEEIMADIYEYIGKLEEIAGKKFGDVNNPLLVSVRSGARASMPGMMDTILNLGLNDEAVEGLAKLTNNPRFAYDSYRRFVQMFSDVVMEMSKSDFEKIIDEMKEAKGVTQDVELDADDMKELVVKFKDLYKEKMGKDFPSDPKEQLIEAVKAVFRSWDNPRANVYRRMNEIPYDWGTAVNVQCMAFGNSGNRSGTGVAFTRNPATGEKALFGEYLINAQGEDVVAGIRTPSPISKLKEEMPEVYEQFAQIAQRLENHYRDMQDMEFTIENGKLFMLQTRNGKRTAAAALKIAVDLVDEGMITEEEAVEEAEYVLGLLEGYEINMPVVFDMEVLQEDARANDLTSSQRAQISKAFCDTIRAAGYTPMIYGNTAYYMSKVDFASLAGEYGIWLAQYYDEPFFPYQFNMWQYTNDGTVDGIAGTVDINLYFGE